MHIAVIISNCLREERRILAAASMPVQVMNYISLIYTTLICPRAFRTKSYPLIVNSTRVTYVHWGVAKCYPLNSCLYFISGSAAANIAISDFDVTANLQRL